MTLHGPATVAEQTAHPAPRGVRGLLAPGGLAVVAALGAGYLYQVDPNVPGVGYPPCLWLSVTHTYCPGCGMARALHALLHLDVATMMQRNPLTPVILGYLLATYVSWAYRSATGAPVRWLSPPWVLWLVFAGLLAFWVLRNVPGWTWLSPV